MSNFASVFSNEGHAVEIAFRQEYEPSSITNEVMKRIVLFLIGLSACVCVTAAEASKKDKASQPTPLKTLLRDAHSAIKNKRDQAKHINTLQEALKREGLTSADSAEILFTQSELSVSLNDAENMKAYLRQKYDTAAYFNTLLSASEYALRCDSADIRPNAKGKVKASYRSKNRDLLLRHRPNIYAGGRFYLRKNDYAKSVPFFRTYIDMVEAPLLQGEKKLENDTLLARSCFYLALAAYNNKQSDVVLQYIDRAMEGVGDSLKPDLHEYKVRCRLAVGDTAQWLQDLREGCTRFPRHDYFFTQIMEYVDETGKYEMGLGIADSMLARVQDIPLYWYAKSVMYLRMGRYAECVEMSDSVISRDAKHLEALRNKGVCLLNLAMEYEEIVTEAQDKTKREEARKQLHQYYVQARTPFERLRELQPDRKDIWATPLYRIYLNLNMGKEFDEMEKVLKGQ